MTKLKSKLFLKQALSLVMLFSLLFAAWQFLAVSSAQAGSWLDTASDGGLKEIGSTAYGQNNPKDIRIVVALIIKVVLGFLGIIFLALLVFAGFTWMTSAGNEDRAKKARDQIITAVIGLVIIITAYAITSYVTGCLMDITTGSTIWMCNKVPLQ